MKPLLLLALSAFALAPAAAQQSAPPTVRVDFSNPAATPSEWTLVLHPDGTGHFRARPGSISSDQRQIEVPPIDRPFAVSAQFAQRVFEVSSSRHVLEGKCDSGMKVAFQGWKTITYQDAGQQGSCRFNFSRDHQVQQLGESFMALATTLVEGARLQLLHEHDPLGLDKEIGFMVEASHDGRIQQLCAIRAILESVEQDPAVMEMVRKRVRQLLARADN